MRSKACFWVLVSLISVAMLASGCGLKSRKGGARGAAIGGQDIPLTTTVEGVDFYDAKDSAFKGGEAEKVLQDVHFSYNDPRVVSEDEPRMKDIAEFLKGTSSAILLVEGHCDERGTSEYNLALGEKRALYVRSFLIALGVAADRVHTISYGKEKPLDAGHTESAWKQNRRAHFMIGKK